MYCAIFIALLIGCSQSFFLDTVMKNMFSSAADRLFDAADVNHDTLISYPEILSEFAKIDTDMSGEVSRHEFTEFVCADVPDLYNMGHYLFDEFDFNGDHHLQTLDYRLMLNATDANHDEFSSRKEFTDYAFDHIVGFLLADRHPEWENHGASDCHNLG